MKQAADVRTTQIRQRSNLLQPVLCACQTSPMRATGAAFLGVFSFLMAGFVRGMGLDSSDPELILAAFYALAACGTLGVLAGGIAIGIQLSRD
jgi:hypothetical protein